MASTAVTQTLASPHKTTTDRSNNGRLKYANARDLPSFPSTGLKKDGAAASAAASLGWANQKSLQQQQRAQQHQNQPTTLNNNVSRSATVAALLANDHKMAAPTNSNDSLQQSAAGSQAALVAAGAAQRHQQRKSESASTWGTSAANLAFTNSASKSTAPQVTPTEKQQGLSRQASMRAAKGAMGGARPRSMSTPITTKQEESYPDQANASFNALNAATIAHRPTMRPSNIPADGAGAVPYTTMNRQMFTSRPPVKPETDEQQRADVLHASALAMAKRMYTQQQRMIDTTKARQRSSSFSRAGGDSTGASTEEPQPMIHNSLQEAAYRLAQERLAKLQEEHQKNRGLQEYYGAAGLGADQNRGGGVLGSVRAKLARRRSSSDGDLIAVDQQRSRQIRKQMSLFNTKLEEVDEQKRTRDRQALLAVAQRNVKSQLQSMDEKVNAETGRLFPGASANSSNMNGDWERKAQLAARARFDAASRAESERNKIDIGGGKVMDREAVQEIAAKRVQPLLDEINENAERERERRAMQKAEEERVKEEAERAKMREREIQQIHKKLKDQQKDEEKARKAEMKQEEKARKEEEKSAKAEQKRLTRDVKQKEKEGVLVLAPTTTTETKNGPEVSPTRAPVWSEEAAIKSPLPQTPQPTYAAAPNTTRNEPEDIKPQSRPTTAQPTAVDPNPDTQTNKKRSTALSIPFAKLHKREKSSTYPSSGTDQPALPPKLHHRGKSEGFGANGADDHPPLSKSESKVKQWFKSRFHRQNRPKSSSSAASLPITAPINDSYRASLGTTAVTGHDDHKGFIGGATLARKLHLHNKKDENNDRDSVVPDFGGPATTIPDPERITRTGTADTNRRSVTSRSLSLSMREVALAGRPSTSPHAGVVDGNFDLVDDDDDAPNETIGQSGAPLRAIAVANTKRNSKTRRLSRSVSSLSSSSAVDDDDDADSLSITSSSVDNDSIDGDVVGGSSERFEEAASEFSTRDYEDEDEDDRIYGESGAVTPRPAAGQVASPPKVNVVLPTVARTLPEDVGEGGKESNDNKRMSTLSVASGASASGRLSPSTSPYRGSRFSERFE